MDSIIIHEKTLCFKKRRDFWQQVEAGTWEPETFDILDKYIKADRIFIDVGAWNGVCSLYACKLGAVCYALEPDLTALKELLENVVENNADIAVRRLALADKKGTPELSNIENDFGNSMSSLINRHDSKAVREVCSNTLEGFIEDEVIDPLNICLIKIDTEGSEVLIIPQAKDFLRKNSPVVYLSLHPYWFPDLEADSERIWDAISETYEVLDVKRQVVLDREGFFAEMRKLLHGLEVLLIPKIKT